MLHEFDVELGTQCAHGSGLLLTTLTPFYQPRPSTWKTSPISTLMKSELLSFNGHYYLLGRSLKNKMAGEMTIFYIEILTSEMSEKICK